MKARIFLLGVVIFFIGIQLRSFETFVLNEKVTKVINQRVAKRQVETVRDPLDAGFMAFGAAPPEAETVELPSKRQITPPRWLGYSFLSIGAVLVMSCPLCRS